MEKRLVLDRFKITFVPFLGILKVRDIKREFKFRGEKWPDGYKMKYKRKDSLQWYDLGFRGTVYSLNQMALELQRLIEKEE